MEYFSFYIDFFFFLGGILIRTHLKSYKTKTDNIIIIFKCEISIKLLPSVYDFLAHRINIYNVCIGIFFFLKLFYSIYYIYIYIYSSKKAWAADCLGQLDLSSICAYLSPRGSGLVECCVYHMGCSLMVGVLVLHLERSGLSDSPNKSRIVHMVLPIAVTWREVDEPTPKTPVFIQQKKKKVECCVSILKYFLLISFQLKRYFNYLLYGNWKNYLYVVNFNYMIFLMSHVTCLNDIHR